MPYAILEQKLKAVPEEYFEQVAGFLDLILKASHMEREEKPKKKPIIGGLAEGKYKIPDDINAFDDEIADMFEGYL